MAVVTLSEMMEAGAHLGIRPVVGTPRCRATSIARATVFTSLTLCNCGLHEQRLQVDAFSSTKRQAFLFVNQKQASEVVALEAAIVGRPTSISAGWEACSPTGRP